VDGNIITEVYQIDRIEQSAATPIVALFILMGGSNIVVQQDPISWDKLYEMIINFINKILGFIVNTRDMKIQAPPDYIAQVVKLMTNTWHKGRKSFTLKEAETLTGLLNQITQGAPWLKHMVLHMCTSISHALGSNTSYLICTNK